MKFVTRINNRIQKLNINLSNIQFLTSSNIKIIAVITMFIDHLSKILLSSIINYYYYPLSAQGIITRESVQKIENAILD